jgi:hypothetical protein
MVKIQLPNREFGFEPAPRFASDAEIELAEQLRRQLEERYFGRAAAPSSSPVRPGKETIGGLKLFLLQGSLKT